MVSITCFPSSPQNTQLSFGELILLSPSAVFRCGRDRPRPPAPRESPDWFHLNSMAHPLVSQFRDGHVASCGPMRVSPRGREAGLVFSWRGHGWWCEVRSSCSPFAVTKEKPLAARDPVIPESEFRTTGGRRGRQREPGSLVLFQVPKPPPRKPEPPWAFQLNEWHSGMSLSVSFLDVTLIYSKTNPKHKGWGQGVPGVPGHCGSEGPGSGSCAMRRRLGQAAVGIMWQPCWARHGRQ